MTFQQKHVKTLELDKVLAMLADLTGCEESRQMALSIEPLTDFESVKRLMKFTSDANSLSNRYGTPSVQGIKNCSTALTKAQKEGRLSPRELLDVGGILRVTRAFHDWKRQSADLTCSLDRMFQLLTPNKALEQLIEQSILSEEEIADSASTALADIRRKIRASQLKVREHLDNMLRSTAQQKYLQELLVTQRDGRFVVPVKAEYRGEVKGLVHDTSASGATLFIEPMSVVESNNEIRMLEIAEQKEIDRILGALSAAVGEQAGAIRQNYDLLVRLDLYFAKSSLADRMKATVPSLNNNGHTILKKARHPLIDAQKVVPIDLQLGGEYDSLIITGPNTGGKTVALKTVGLLTLMAMCGLMIPASEASRISVFEQVLADIGDEQSIEQNLSTFSSHMTNIIEIVKGANAKSLILLDELGAGTDPVEGAALAIAIIDTLRASGARLLATTHYAELKMYALQTEHIENASCEFDVATLRPTYRLITGVPGRSNAFAISARLGMDASLIERAKENLSNDAIRFEDVVEQLENTRQQLEIERDTARRYRNEIEQTRAEITREKKSLDQYKENEMQRTKEEGLSMIATLKAQSQQMFDEIDELLRKKESENFAQMVSQVKVSYNTSIKKLENLADPVTKKATLTYKLPRTLKQGDRVLVSDLNLEGTVMSKPDGNGMVTIQSGILKSKVHIDTLRLLDDKNQVTVNNTRVLLKTQNTDRKNTSIKTELDIRGSAVDDGILEVDRFIDAAVMSGIQTLSIIHGKGTGVLRTAIQQHLKRHKSVRTFRLGTFGEGESGVTIVELK